MKVKLITPYVVFNFPTVKEACEYVGHFTNPKPKKWSDLQNLEGRKVLRIRKEWVPQ